MKLYTEKERYKLYHGNMLDMLEVIEPNSIDSIVCDPPYELNFMGKGWDNSGIAFNKDAWTKCYEVLKPGGYLLAFGGSRTYHRIACAIEDAGFEIRDCIMYLYGSGFPKSLDISKAIDKRPNRSYNNLIKFGRKLKEQRELKGYTKNEIDKIMGTNTAYSWWEGRNYLGEFKIQLPDKENYLKLKAILDLKNDMDFIFEEAEREIIGTKKKLESYKYKGNNVYQTDGDKEKIELNITLPSTDLAKQWNGWGTALKPAYEPIIVARKPFKTSVVENIMQYGVGGINIDECRIANENEKLTRNLYDNPSWKNSSTNGQGSVNDIADKLGRFPSNVIHDGSEEAIKDMPNTNGGERHNKVTRLEDSTSYGGKSGYINTRNEFNDSGSASRYFYCAKASKKDRDEGLDMFDSMQVNDGRETSIDNAFQRGDTLRKNIHPTVKPVELMQYLVRLVTPKNGITLDCFMGSGSTGKATMFENRERNANYKFIGIELTEEYLPICASRIDYALNKYEYDAQKEIEEAHKEGQMTIFDFID